MVAKKNYKKSIVNSYYLTDIRDIKNNNNFEFILKFKKKLLLSYIKVSPEMSCMFQLLYLH